MLGLFKKGDRDRVTVNITNQTVIRVVIIIILSMLLLSGLHRASHALILLAIAFFLALALNAPVRWLSDHLPGSMKGNRSVATSISFLLIIILLSGFIYSIAPPLIRDTGNFINSAPQLLRDVHDQNTQLGRVVRQYHLENAITNFSNQLGGRIQDVAGAGFSTITKITSSIFSILAILVLTFMMLIEGPRWLDFFRRLIPKHSQKHVTKLASDMYEVIRGYVNGQVLLAVIAGVLILFPLLILGISYPVALMVLVFIAALIPLVGHPIGAVIVTTVALFHSTIAAVIVLLYYILYIQIENYVLQPKIQANSTNMSPLLVLVAVIVGVNFDGLIGGLFAIPLAGCIRIAFLDYVEGHDLIDKKELTEDTK